MNDSKFSVQDSFSQKLKNEVSQNSSDSLEIKQLKTKKHNKQQLPIISNQKLPQKRKLFADQSKRQSNSSFSRQIINNHEMDVKGNQYVYSNSNNLQNNKNIKIEEYKNVLHDINHQVQGIQQFAIYSGYNEQKDYTSKITKPSYQQYITQQYLAPVGNSSSSFNSPSGKLIQRRLNTSSRKSINISNMRNQKQVSPSHYRNPPHSPTSFRVQNTLPSHQMQPNICVHQQQYLQERQMYLMQRQAQLQRRQLEIEQQQSKRQIKTFSTLTQVPYYEKYIQYEPEVIMVPKQKIIEKKYTLQNLVDYVPKVQECIQGYDIIPRQVIKHRLQYQLVQQRIVHIPKDEAWIGSSFNTNMHKIKRRNLHVNEQTVGQNGYINNNGGRMSVQRGFSIYTNNTFGQNGVGQRLLYESGMSPTNRGNIYNIRNQQVNRTSIDVGNVYGGQINANYYQNVYPNKYQNVNQNVNQNMYKNNYGDIIGENKIVFDRQNQDQVYNKLIDYYTGKNQNRLNRSVNKSDKKCKQTYHVTSQANKIISNELNQNKQQKSKQN